MKAYSWSLDERPPPTTIRDKWWRFVERRLPGVVMFLMVATLVVVVLAPHMVVTVPSGHVGVLWKRFARGTVRDPRQLLHVLLDEQCANTRLDHRREGSIDFTRTSGLHD